MSQAYTALTRSVTTYISPCFLRVADADAKTTIATITRGVKMRNTF